MMDFLEELAEIKKLHLKPEETLLLHIDAALREAGVAHCRACGSKDIDLGIAKMVEEIQQARNNI